MWLWRRPLRQSVTWVWLTAMGRCVSVIPGGKVNHSQLNEAHHCPPRVFDLPAVGQNLSGVSRMGPRPQCVSTQEGWQGKAEDVGGAFIFIISFLSGRPAHWRQKKMLLLKNPESVHLSVSFIFFLSFLAFSHFAEYTQSTPFCRLLSHTHTPPLPSFLSHAHTLSRCVTRQHPNTRMHTLTHLTCVKKYFFQPFHFSVANYSVV